MIEECNTLLVQATQRILKQVKNPFLFLSGGVDSRVILGMVLSMNENIPVACYGTGEGDDFTVARALAKHCKLPITEFVLSNRTPSSKSLVSSTLNSDCRAETIFTPTLYEFFNELSGQYCTFINGDECFGWRKTIKSSSDAFNEVGLLRLSQVGLLEDLLIRYKRRGVARDIEGTLGFLNKESNETDPDNLKDHLYYQERLGNKQNAFTAMKLRFFEQARPLIDEDVIGFVTRLPIAMRNDKYLLRRVLEKKYSYLLDVPLSATDSLPTEKFYSKMLSQDEYFSKFVRNQLLEEMDCRLASLMNKDRFNMFIEKMVNGTALSEIQRRWWMHLPGMWRFASFVYENRIHPITLVLRILQLNIYLKNLEGQ